MTLEDLKPQVRELLQTIDPVEEVVREWPNYKIMQLVEVYHQAGGKGIPLRDFFLDLRDAYEEAGAPNREECMSEVLYNLMHDAYYKGHWPTFEDLNY